MSFFSSVQRVAGKGRPLREILREETRAEHQALDRELAALDLSRRTDYARLLRFHAVARSGVEQWLADHAPADLAPPGQFELVCRDIVALGEHPPACAPAFEGADPRGWIGVAYVIAGSHLGNRVLLGRLDPGLAANAAEFLGGAAMASYWRDFRALPEQEPGRAATARAVTAARATFSHFSRIAATTGAVLPA